MISNVTKTNIFLAAVLGISLSLLLVTSFGLSNIVNAQGSIGTACEKPSNYVGGPIYRFICNGNTIVTEQCSTVEDCHALYSKEYQQCKDGSDECARKCEKIRSDSCASSNGAPGCGDVRIGCLSSCSEVNVQCYKMVRDDAEKCEKKRQWEKSHTIGNIECEAGTPCVQVCDTGTQCVQNGDDARCVRSSEQPAFPPAENPISATSEATTPPTENTPEVEALVGKQPTENDLQKKPNTTVGAKLPEYMIVERMTGGGDMQLPDGSWATLHVGDKIPKGARIFTSYASEATIAAPNGIVLLILALSEFGIEDLNNRDAAIWKVRIKLGSGDVRFKVNQGDFRTDMQVSTPVDTGAVTGTDFAVSYNKESSIAIWEIYDHSIEVTSHITGETKTISSSYGQPIKRIEVAKNGAMTEQIAIPKDEWQARQASQTEPQSQPEENRSNGLPWVFIFLALGGIGFMLHKTGKLQPMLQRVSALVRRDNKPI